MDNDAAHPFFDGGGSNLGRSRQGDEADLEVGKPLRRDRHRVAAVEGEELLAFGEKVIFSGRQGEGKGPVAGAEVVR